MQNSLFQMATVVDNEVVKSIIHLLLEEERPLKWFFFYFFLYQAMNWACFHNFFNMQVVKKITWDFFDVIVNESNF